MRIHYLIHAPFEKLGVIAEWIQVNQHEAKSTHAYRGEPLPALDSFDFLIIMGGPQSAVEIEKYPYLQAEAVFIKEAIAANKYVLGVCLGAQLISIALGGKVIPSPHQEIGVFPVTLTPEAKADPIFCVLPVEFPVMHWHQDMATAIPGTTLLATSAGCPQQAFRYSDRVYGVQFHLELTPNLVEALVLNSLHDLHPSSTYIQSKETILQADLQPINAIMWHILDQLTRQVE